MFRKRKQSTADEIEKRLKENTKERYELLNMVKSELTKLNRIINAFSLEMGPDKNEVKVEDTVNVNTETKEHDEGKESKKKKEVGKSDLYICAKCLKVFNYEERFKHYEERKTHRPIAHIPSLLGDRSLAAENIIKTRIEKALKNTRYSYDDVVRKASKATKRKVVKREVEPKKVRDRERKKSHYHKMKNMPRICLKCQEVFNNHADYKKHYTKTKHKPIMLIDAIERRSHAIKQPLANHGLTIDDAVKTLEKVKNYSKPKETQKGSHKNYAVSKDEIEGYGYVCMRCEDWFPTRQSASHHSNAQGHTPTVSVTGFLENNHASLAAVKRNNYTEAEASIVINRALKKKKVAI